MDKIARQMRKYKTRLLRRHRPRKEDIRHLEEHILNPEPDEAEDDHHEHAVVRTERIPLKPMFVDEAVLQIGDVDAAIHGLHERAQLARQRALSTQKWRLRVDRAHRCVASGS